MCGRYYVDEESNEELLRIIRNLDKRLQIKTGEVYPSNLAPVIIKDKDHCDAMTWGIPNPKAKGLLINARGETAHQKPMFSESLLQRRIVIPASGFYEWDHNPPKNKYYFHKEDSSAIYMAGLYRYVETAACFVILTTAANSCMESTHNRMPVLLDRDEIDDYLNSQTKAEQIIKRIPTNLMRTMIDEGSSYSQITLPL